MSKHFIMTACAAILLNGITSAPVYAKAATPGLKTAGACDDEYKANKGALKDAKEKKKDFITACRALAPGTPTPIGTSAAAPSQAPSAAPAAPVPQQTAAPRQASAPAAPAPSAPSTSTATASGESACANGYAHLPTSHTAVQFCTDQEAKAHCPGQAVVWVNTQSKIYHHAGTNTYGHTKQGAYMCEADATAEGDRVSKNGH